MRHKREPVDRPYEKKSEAVMGRRHFLGLAGATVLAGSAVFGTQARAETATDIRKAINAQLTPAAKEILDAFLEAYATKDVPTGEFPQKVKEKIQTLAVKNDTPTLHVQVLYLPNQPDNTELVIVGYKDHANFTIGRARFKSLAELKTLLDKANQGESKYPLEGAGREIAYSNAYSMRKEPITETFFSYHTQNQLPTRNGWQEIPVQFLNMATEPTQRFFTQLFGQMVN